MKWPYMVFLTAAVAGMMLLGANKIAGLVKIGENPTMVADANNFEKSPDKLKKLISTHRAFHEKIRIVFTELIEELEPHLDDSDSKELQKLINDFLNQYGDEINGAEKALQANDIVLTNVFLTSAARELKNLRSAQETLLDLKRQIAPKSSPAKQKNIA